MKKLLGSLELNRIYQLDVNDGMKLIPDNSISLILADPPYNIGKKGRYLEANNKKFRTVKEDWDTIDDFESFTYSWLEESYRVLKPGGSLLTYGTKHNIYMTGWFIEKIGLQIRTEYTWYKTNAAPCWTGRNPTESTENIIWASKGSGWTYNLDYAKSLNDGKNIRNVIVKSLTPPREKKHGKHPTQKPLEGLTDILINLHSNEGDIILVPFCGSGTECVGAEMLNRHWISFETNPEYIVTANKRLDSLYIE
ncbi:DNA-methyltransferase [Brevibacillus borstelensis]|uniref:DNA-methyltransferase n=1 Tax=Brevibacillus borstelensis TaxID=45462 RepID=UPI00287FD4FF|nr:site-specific DNA-methyltransferase [Brevibacillus borstelensis]MED1874853.1 site-specific DNA-methyltransferase [Brevibacillus borstelensis]WNF04317.1 site-specific DNA-methyltransferase [Brevibacillus borstelensis]